MIFLLAFGTVPTMWYFLFFKDQTHNQNISQWNISISVRLRLTVFNATFNNMSVMLWWSVLFVEKARVPLENNRPATSH